MLPFLKILGDRKEWGFREIIERLAKTFKVSHVERQEMIPSGQRIFDYRVGYSRTLFKKAALVESTRHGYLRITQNGIIVLKKNPNFIDVKFLKQIPEFNKNQAPKTGIEKDKSIIKTMVEKKTGTNKESKLGLDISYIQALGNLLTYYHSDLIYIREFQRLSPLRKVGHPKLINYGLRMGFSKFAFYKVINK
jgi:restriction endonuclease Mrr